MRSYILQKQRMNPLILSGIIVVVGVLIFLLVTQKKKGEIIFQSSQDTTKHKETRVDKNIYADLRNQALSVTHSQLQLDIDSSSTTLYGVVVDFDMGPAIVTIVAFKSGDASVYLNTGQMFIGGYGREKIRNSGLKLVNEAQSYLDKTKLTALTDLPGKQNIKFFLLTNKGKFFHEEPFANIESNKSEWSKLFYLANDIVTQYRLIDQNK